MCRRSLALPLPPSPPPTFAITDEYFSRIGNVGHCVSRLAADALPTFALSVPPQPSKGTEKAAGQNHTEVQTRQGDGGEGTSERYYCCTASCRGLQVTAPEQQEPSFMPHRPFDISIINKQRHNHDHSSTNSIVGSNNNTYGSSDHHCLRVITRRPRTRSSQP